MGRGLFVTIDGIGGAGKTTTARLVVDQLNKDDIRAVYTREPSDSATGQFVRAQFNSLTGHALAALVASDRFDHLATVVLPALEQATIVVCDRYVPSSLVLQPLDGVPDTYVEALNAPTLRPDLAVVLTAPPDTAWARIVGRGSHGRFEEGIDQSAAEHAAYQRITTRLRGQGWNIHALDTDIATAPQVAAAIVALIKSYPPMGRQ
jgi:dTMP kinase